MLPHLEAREVVITDRCVPSALVMRQLGGVDPNTNQRPFVPLCAPRPAAHPGRPVLRRPARASRLINEYERAA
jgi:hypothetical protein